MGIRDENYNIFFVLMKKAFRDYISPFIVLCMLVMALVLFISYIHLKGKLKDQLQLFGQYIGEYM